MAKSARSQVSVNVGLHFEEAGNSLQKLLNNFKTAVSGNEKSIFGKGIQKDIATYQNKIQELSKFKLKPDNLYQYKNLVQEFDAAWVNLTQHLNTTIERQDLITKEQVDQAKAELERLKTEFQNTFGVAPEQVYASDGKNKTRSYKTGELKDNVVAPEGFDASAAGAKRKEISAQTSAYNKLNAEYIKSKDLINEIASAKEFVTQVEGAHTKALEKENDALQSYNAQVAIASEKDLKDSLIGQIQKFSALVFSVNAAKNAFNKMKQTYQEVDKSVTAISMVSGLSRDDLWKDISRYNDMARELGRTTTDALEASKIFYQQGLSTNEVLILTEQSLKLAAIAETDTANATNYLTTAINGFKLTAEDTEMVMDSWAELAGRTAVEVEDIATAISKVASIAQSAGMELQSTSAFLTQIMNTTREAPETAGTALKTIIARFQELKKSNAELEDGVTANKVEQALKSANVELRDSAGQFRNFDDVILELSSKWDGLDRNTQRYIATIAAGSRQQSRFIALVDDYDGLLQTMEYSYESAGAAGEQFTTYNEGLEASLNRVRASWEDVYLSFSEGENLISGFLETVAKLLEILAALPANFGIIGTGIAGVLGKIGLDMLSTKIAGSGSWIDQGGLVQYILFGQGKQNDEGQVLERAGGLINAVKGLFKSEAVIDKPWIDFDINELDQLVEHANAFAKQGLAAKDIEQELGEVLTERARAQLAAQAAESAGNLTTEQLIQTDKKHIAVLLQKAAAWIAANIHIIAIVAAIGALITVIALLITHEQRQIKKLKEEIAASQKLSEQYSDRAKDLHKLAQAYEEAAKAGEDFSELNQQLLEQYPEIAATLDLDVASYEDIAEAINEAEKAAENISGQAALQSIGAKQEIKNQSYKGDNADDYKIDTSYYDSATGQLVTSYYWRVGGKNYYTAEDAERAIEDLNNSIQISEQERSQAAVYFSNSIDFDLSSDTGAGVKEFLEDISDDFLESAEYTQEVTKSVINENGETVQQTVTELTDAGQEALTNYVTALNDAMQAEIEVYANDLMAEGKATSYADAMRQATESVNGLVSAFYNLDGSLSNVDVERLKEIMAAVYGADSAEYAAFLAQLEQQQQDFLVSQGARVRNIVEANDIQRAGSFASSETDFVTEDLLTHELGTEMGNDYAEGFANALASINDPQILQAFYDRIKDWTYNGIEGLDLDQMLQENGIEPGAFFNALASPEAAATFFETHTKFLETTEQGAEIMSLLNQLYGKNVIEIGSMINKVDALRAAEEELNKYYEDGLESQEEAFLVASTYAQDYADFILATEGRTLTLAEATNELEESFYTSAEDGKLYSDTLNNLAKFLGKNSDAANENAIALARAAVTNSMLALTALDSADASEEETKALAQQVITTLSSYGSLQEAADALGMSADDLWAALGGEGTYNPSNIDNWTTFLTDKADELNSIDVSAFMGNDNARELLRQEINTRMQAAQNLYAEALSRSRKRGAKNQGSGGKSELERQRELLDKQKEILEAEGDAQEKRIKLIQEELKARKDALKEEQDAIKDAFEQQQEQWEIRLEYVRDTLEAEREALEEAADAAEDAAQKEIDAAKRAAEGKINLIQMQIDAMDEEADAENRLLELQKARDEYERARTSKTRLVLTKGAGWIFKTDNAQVEDAAANLKDTERDYQKSLLEAQIAEIEKVVESMEDVEGLLGMTADEIAAMNEATKKWSDYIINGTFADEVATQIGTSVVDSETGVKQIDPAGIAQAAINASQAVADWTEKFEPVLEALEAAIERLGTSMEDMLLDTEAEEKILDDFFNQIVGAGGTNEILSALDGTMVEVEASQREMAEKSAAIDETIKQIDEDLEAWDEQLDLIGLSTSEIEETRKQVEEFKAATLDELGKNGKYYAEIAATLKDLAAKWEQYNIADRNLQAQEDAEKGYSSGGVANFRGRAMLHGSTSRPEVVLNNSQAAALFNWINGLGQERYMSIFDSLDMEVNKLKLQLNSIGAAIASDSQGDTYNFGTVNIESDATSLDQLVTDIRRLSPLTHNR